MKILKFILFQISFLLIVGGVDAQIAMPAFQAVQYVGNGNVLTTTITNITSSGATSGGTISGSLGVIISRGVCWSKINSNPDLTNSKSVNGAGIGTFMSNLQGLGSNSTYYVRAYATNSNNITTYGNVVSFTTPQITNGYLNYDIYSATSASVNSSNDMNNAISNAGTAYDSGVMLGSTVINYTSYTQLTAAGAKVPNSGDNFIVDVTGIFMPSEKGTYTFTCEGDDAVDLYINGTLITSQYGANSASALGTHKGTIYLRNNRTYTFEARMKENAGNEVLRVFWQAPSQSSSGTWYQNSNEIKPVSSNTSGDPDGTTYYDGQLNYTVYSSAYSSPSNESQFDAQLAAATVFGSGVADANVVVNFSVYTDLTSKGISIPNNGDGFSIISEGYFIPKESGNYTFTCEGDDAVDLFVNGINVANNYGGHAASALGTHTGTISLTAGTKYTFKARHQENRGGEVLKVYWKKPSQSSGSTWYLDTAEISSQ